MRPAKKYSKECFDYPFQARNQEKKSFPLTEENKRDLKIISSDIIKDRKLFGKWQEPADSKPGPTKISLWKFENEFFKALGNLKSLDEIMLNVSAHASFTPLHSLIQNHNSLNQVTVRVSDEISTATSV